MTEGSVGKRARDVVDFTRHYRVREPEDDPVAWPDRYGIVHNTEAMMNPIWGVDRITLCRLYKLNPSPQQSHSTLKLHPAKEAVSCLLCLAL